MREIKFRFWHPTREVFEYSSLEEIFYMKSELRYDALVCSQYTGLKDKNGKEIYEGDIITGFSYREDLRKVVTLDINDDFLYWHMEYANDSEKVYEVIGNIHENPELLE